MSDTSDDTMAGNMSDTVAQFYASCLECGKSFSSRESEARAAKEAKGHCNARHPRQFFHHYGQQPSRYTCQICYYSTPWTRLQFAHEKSEDRRLAVAAAAAAASNASTYAAAVASTSSNKSNSKNSKSSKSNNAASSSAAPAATAAKVKKLHVEADAPRDSEPMPLIRQRMEEKGLTSEDMDEELELEDGGFEAILRGEVLLDADQVERISSILDMSPMRLLLLPIGWSSTSVRPSMPSLAKDSVPEPRRGHH